MGSGASATVWYQCTQDNHDWTHLRIIVLSSISISPTHTFPRRALQFYDFWFLLVGKKGKAILAWNLSIKCFTMFSSGTKNGCRPPVVASLRKSFLPKNLSASLTSSPPLELSALHLSIQDDKASMTPVDFGNYSLWIYNSKI